MGMAASQARYLALTARKTNTEYEGQQINQARTALANQSANLFNRLLNMKVPDPPKTTDYTKVQYSYSDGENASVIDEWHQLSGVNPDYNYLVKSHYYASLYTGAMRQLTDPQVQIAGNGAAIDDWSTISIAKRLLDTHDAAQQEKYLDLQRTLSTESVDILNIQTEAYRNNSEHRIVDSGINRVVDNTIPGSGYTQYTLTNSDTLHAATVKFYDVDPDAVDQGEVGNINSILLGIRDMLDTNLVDKDTLNQYLVSIGSRELINDDNINQITDPLNSPYNQLQKDLLKIYGLESDDQTTRLVLKDDVNAIILDDTGNGTTAHLHILNGVFLADNTVGSDIHPLNYYAADIRDNHQDKIATAQREYDDAYALYTNYLNNYNNNITKPTYIGNSELTPLIELSDEQRVELLQVVKDMNAQDIDTDILNCFDSDNNYLGGIYSFQMNGITYYTTHNSLDEAWKSYPKNKSNNTIDAQYKMPYYNASYVDTRVENESYALLETDGSGRFKTVKFDNNSIVYSLNTETVTDEAAYEDAMNHYLYEKDKYEKTIADINAKTSIIQKEDRTLELRLKQLDTEQLALKTEMDAVKKVIKDNVESTFKTFSD